ncbi:hypothetical protein HYX10_03515 [Candidatus Woesearchaeota archaeon]|nr:hypothetical protein [Candidatus Woesearchaeota archaeon]
MPEKKPKADTHSYKGWLNSDSFLKRAFACLGYQTVATLIIYGIFLGVAILIVAFFGTP